MISGQTAVMHGMITVVQVMLDIGIEPTNELCWPVGNEVRDVWVLENGRPPFKELRQKTNGHGSHCFAVYPADWYFRIRAIILRHNAEAQRQGDLFK
jgi:hypothetical protein